MVLAQRKIRLTDVEQPEPLAPLQPRPLRRPSRFRRVTGLVRPAVITLGVALGVFALVVFVNTYARIAECEMQYQTLKQQDAQLTRENSELALEVERLATGPQLAKETADAKLEMPDPTRVHFVPGATDYPQTATRPPAAAEASWAQHSGQQVMASLNAAWQLLGGSPAYAQD